MIRWQHKINGRYHKEKMDILVYKKRNSEYDYTGEIYHQTLEIIEYNPSDFVDVI